MENKPEEKVKLELELELESESELVVCFVLFCFALKRNHFCERMERWDTQSESTVVVPFTRNSLLHKLSCQRKKRGDEKSFLGVVAESVLLLLRSTVWHGMSVMNLAAGILNRFTTPRIFLIRSKQTVYIITIRIIILVKISLRSDQV